MKGLVPHNNDVAIYHGRQAAKICTWVATYLGVNVVQLWNQKSSTTIILCVTKTIPIYTPSTGLIHNKLSTHLTPGNMKGPWLRLADAIIQSMLDLCSRWQKWRIGSLSTTLTTKSWICSKTTNIIMTIWKTILGSISSSTWWAWGSRWRKDGINWIERAAAYLYLTD